jgi:hypothetical protein
VVPRPAITGIVVDKLGKLYQVTFNQRSGKAGKAHILYGLNIDDLEAEQPVAIVYALGCGIDLMADSYAITRALTGINSSCPKETPCLNHYVNSLQIITTRPEWAD